MTIWFFIAGMFEKSDSIAYDLLCQQRLLQQMLPDVPTEIVARDLRREHYPMPVTEWREHLARGIDPAPGDVVIYHYCDGWEEFEERALGYEGVQRIWRWHNNTPPWFFMDKAEWVANTMRGFRGVVKAAERGGWLFATNSRFTSRQLQALVPGEVRHAVVYPASVHLQPRAVPERPPLPAEGPLKLLFVGRVVPHKSHALVIDLAGRAARRLGREIEVHFAGRPASEDYLAQLRRLASVQPAVTLYLHGEVSDEALRTLYSESHVFTCFSQHEGFGLPVYEAMRYGMPVMAALTSAFEELLDGHPLCARGADLDAFAERLAALLASPELLAAALAHQARVLEHYTETTIQAQLAAMLGGGEALAGQGHAPGTLTHFPRSFDAQRQFFTDDDARVFDKFLGLRDDAPAQRRMNRLGRWQYLDPERFSSHRPRKVNEALEWHYDDADELQPFDYLFFGPYVALPPGLYRGQFCIDTELPPDGSLALEFDCTLGGETPLRTDTLRAGPHAGRRAHTLEFYFEVPPQAGAAKLEFRCRLLGPWSAGAQLWFRWAAYLPVCL